MNIKCRACLATSDAKMYHSLKAVFSEYMGTDLSILELLEVVTSTKVNMSYALPDSICTACLKQLRECYRFIKQFKYSQSWLFISQELNPEPEKIIVKVESIDETFSTSAVLDIDGNDVVLTDFTNEVQDYKGEEIIPKRRTVKRQKARTISKVRKRREYVKVKNLRKNKDGLILMSIEDVLNENKTTVNSKILLNNKAKKSNNIEKYHENVAITNDQTDTNDDIDIEDNKIDISIYNNYAEPNSDIEDNKIDISIDNDYAEPNSGIEDNEKDISIDNDYAEPNSGIEDNDKDISIHNDYAETNNDIEPNEENISMHNDHTYVLDSSITSTALRSLAIRKKRTKGIITQSTELVKNLEKKTEIRRAQKETVKNPPKLSFICSVCLEGFDTKNKLIAHESAGHYSKLQMTFVCSDCGLKCRTRSAYICHRLKHQEKLNCDLCEKSEMTKYQLTDHKRNVHGISVRKKSTKDIQEQRLKAVKNAKEQRELPFVCPICSKRFDTNKKMISHKSANHDSQREKKFTCSPCGLQLRTQSGYIYHMQKHAEKHNCDLCEKTDMTKYQLADHKRKIHGLKFIRTSNEKMQEQSFICEICSKVYDTPKKLKTHVYHIHYTAWNEKFKCSECGLQCRNRSAFVHHTRKHKGRNSKCDLCEKTYLTPTQLKEHKARVHGDGVPAKFLCPDCGKTFKFSTSLKYHIISSHNADQKPYMCRFCGFKCIQFSYLKRHERCHTDERPYKCTYCDKTFRGRGDQRLHEANHEKNYKVTCPYCDKGFLKTWNMKIHWLQHKGDHECEICQKSFIDETVLNFHYYHHHKIRDDDKETSEDERNSNNEQENRVSTYFDTNDDEFSHNVFQD